jgi:nitrite reductase/ring-hydroxylating ferredoxin subunit
MKHYIAFIACVILLSCIPQEEIRIPYAPVNLTIHLNYSDSDLVPVYSSKVFKHGGTPLKEDRVGFGGLLVFHNNDSYQAYDLACPVESSSKTVVTLEEGGLFAICSSCGTRYSLIDGGIPVAGSGTYRLHSYRVSQKSSTELIVSN